MLDIHTHMYIYLYVYIYRDTYPHKLTEQSITQRNITDNTLENRIWLSCLGTVRINAVSATHCRWQ